jgi:hypothetical protein
MVRNLVIIGLLLPLIANCAAQDRLLIRTQGSQRQPADAEKIYMSACLAVEREFRITRPIRPSVTLVIGADKNGAYWGPREIRLTQWNPNFFAQGIVMFAFEDLLPDGERVAVAKRAVTWADSTVDAKSPAK